MLWNLILNMLTITAGKIQLLNQYSQNVPLDVFSFRVSALSLDNPWCLWPCVLWASHCIFWDDLHITRCVYTYILKPKYIKTYKCLFGISADASFRESSVEKTQGQTSWPYLLMLLLLTALCTATLTTVAFPDWGFSSCSEWL